jgi:hypothetical protein
MRRKYPGPIFSQFGDALKNNSVEHFPGKQQERAAFRTRRSTSSRMRFNALDWPNPTNSPTCSTMKDVELSDEMDAVLQRLARKSHQSPEQVLRELTQVPAGSPEAPEPIVSFVTGSEFSAFGNHADKYLVLLCWIAVRHPAEFGEFIRGQSSNRRFLRMTRDEVVDACREHEARQIDSTQYWAIMNIDAASKRRFVARVLLFIGYRDAVIEFVSAAVGGRSTSNHSRFAALVA